MKYDDLVESVSGLAHQLNALNEHGDYYLYQRKVAGSFQLPSAKIAPYQSTENNESQADGTRSVPASAPSKAIEQIGESPIQGNVTSLNPTVVTAFQQ